ncbi:MAG: hypothetical protein ABW170_17575 [Candidatus Thiodiazotropha sp. L084R]
MITLNGERGFEKVETWEEITEIPGFEDNLDPKEHQLKEIIGRYIFKDFMPCGLSTCRQPHGKGYIVTTKTGQVTNIGNGCGKTHFGVDFQEQSKIFNRALTEHNNREALATFLFGLESNLEELEMLKAGEAGANSIYMKSKSLIQVGKGVPASVTKQINELVRRRSGDITIPRQASEEEINDLETIQNRKLERPYYIDESVGNLRGLETLYTENDIRKILIKDLQENLKVLSDLDISTATFSELQFWVKWCSQYEQKIESVKKSMKNGILLLNKDNLFQLLATIENTDDVKEFKKWVNQNTLKTHNQTLKHDAQNARAS